MRSKKSAAKVFKARKLRIEQRRLEYLINSLQSSYLRVMQLLAKNREQRYRLKLRLRLKLKPKSTNDSPELKQIKQTINFKALFILLLIVLSVALLILYLAFPGFALTMHLVLAYTKIYLLAAVKYLVSQLGWLLNLISELCVNIGQHLASLLNLNISNLCAGLVGGLIGFSVCGITLITALFFFSGVVLVAKKLINEWKSSKSTVVDPTEPEATQQESDPIITLNSNLLTPITPMWHANQHSTEQVSLSTQNQPPEPGHEAFQTTHSLGRS